MSTEIVEVEVALKHLPLTESHIVYLMTLVEAWVTEGEKFSRQPLLPKPPSSP
jgi:hypothetical protein